MPITVEIVAQDVAELEQIVAKLSALVTPPLVIGNPRPALPGQAGTVAVAASASGLLYNGKVPDAGHADPEGYDAPAVEEDKPAPAAKGKAKAKKEPEPKPEPTTEPAATDLPKVPDDESVSRLEDLRTKAVAILVSVYGRAKQGGHTKVKELIQKYGVRQFADVPLDKVEDLYADALRVDQETTPS